MSTIDLRGFAYALEPLRQRRHWQLDALRLRFARLQAEVQSAQKVLDASRAAHHAAAQHAAGRMHQEMDPRVHFRSLQWLSRLRAQVDQAETSFERLRADCKRAGEECLAHQQKVDATEAHRDEAVTGFLQDANRHQLVEADRAWLARPAMQETQP